MLKYVLSCRGPVSGKTDTSLIVKYILKLFTLLYLQRAEQIWRHSISDFFLNLSNNVSAASNNAALINSPSSYGFLYYAIILEIRSNAALFLSTVLTVDCWAFDFIAIITPLHFLFNTRVNSFVLLFDISCLPNWYTYITQQENTYVLYLGK